MFFLFFQTKIVRLHFQFYFFLLFITSILQNCKILHNLKIRNFEVSSQKCKKK